MPPTRKVRGKRAVSTSAAKESVGVIIPGPSDLNEPPSDFHKYVTCIFGEKGVGKSSLVAQFPGHVVLQAEPRRRNLRIRQFPLEPMTIKDIKKASRGKDSYVTPWMVFQEFMEKSLSDRTVEGVAIDTIDQVYNSAFAHHCWMLGIDNPNEMNDYGATWNLIKDDFTGTLNRFTAHDPEKGLVVTSHATFKEVESRDGGAAYDLLIPTCAKGAYDWIKQACDFAFYYGYYQKQRALYLRGSDLIWASCGNSEYFNEPSGSPIEVLGMGSKPDEAYKHLMQGFNNQASDLKSSSESAETSEKKRKRKVSK